MKTNRPGSYRGGALLAVCLLWSVPACDFEDPRGREGDRRDTESIGAESSRLTAAQCDYFSVDGKTQICHATDSPTNPFVIIRVSGHACVSAHTEHPDDYIAIDDPSCGGLGCLPASAPCDATAPCCDGLSCQGGVCAPDQTEADCSDFSLGDASASGCACPGAQLTCYSDTPGVGILCVDPVTGVQDYGTYATCGAFACPQYGWTSADNCSCTDNGFNPVACTDQHGVTGCHWRQGTTFYDGVYGNDALLACL